MADRPGQNIAPQQIALNQSNQDYNPLIHHRSRGTHPLTELVLFHRTIENSGSVDDFSVELASESESSNSKTIADNNAFRSLIHGLVRPMPVHFTDEFVRRLFDQEDTPTPEDASDYLWEFIPDVSTLDIPNMKNKSEPILPKPTPLPQQSSTCSTISLHPVIPIDRSGNQQKNTTEDEEDKSEMSQTSKAAKLGTFNSGREQICIKVE